MPAAARSGERDSRSYLGALFLGINKLPNFRALLIEIRKVLRPQLLVNLEFLLGGVFFTSANIRLRQAVMHVGQVWIQFARLQILRYGHCVFSLIGVEIS